jgi:hypothetical protein
MCIRFLPESGRELHASSNGEQERGAEGRAEKFILTFVIRLYLNCVFKNGQVQK